MVGIASAVLAAILGAWLLVSNEMNPTIFIAVGEESGEIRAYAEERLDELDLRADLGHDGRFFFVQGNDPWLLDPEEHAAVLDRPIYRSQRMAYPVLASGFGLLPPVGVVWGMLVVNVIGMGAGGYFAARIAADMGGSALWGLAFPLNLGLISEFGLGGAGIVATAAAFAAIVALIRRRPLTAGILFAIACLSREVMLLAVAGAGVWQFLKKERRVAAVVALPLVAVLSWGLYARIVLPPEATVVQGNFDWPFLGLVSNLGNWLNDPLELAVGATTVLILGFFVYRALRRPSLTAWTFLPFIPMAFVLGEAVWDGYFNITRAVAPVLTAYFLITFAADVEIPAMTEGPSEAPG